MLRAFCGLSTWPAPRAAPQAAVDSSVRLR